jgi:uncharacterized protein
VTVPPHDPPPHPSATPPAPPVGSEERGWAAVAHASAFVGAWVALAFVGPLVVYLLGRDRHPFIAHHAREALNFNLTFLLVIVVGGLIGGVGAVVTLGLGLLVILPIAGVIAVAWIVAVVVAAVRAWDGEPFRYPLTIRFVR